jgi:hypothetical protein
VRHLSEPQTNVSGKHGVRSENTHTHTHTHTHKQASTVFDLKTHTQRKRMRNQVGPNQYRRTLLLSMGRWAGAETIHAAERAEQRPIPSKLLSRLKTMTDHPYVTNCAGVEAFAMSNSSPGLERGNADVDIQPAHHSLSVIDHRLLVIRQSAAPTLHATTGYYGGWWEKREGVHVSIGCKQNGKGHISLQAPSSLFPRGHSLCTPTLAASNSSSCAHRCQVVRDGVALLRYGAANPRNPRNFVSEFRQTRNVTTVMNCLCTTSATAECSILSARPAPWTENTLV